jgi:uncharacterized protein
VVRARVRGVSTAILSRTPPPNASIAARDLTGVYIQQYIHGARFEWDRAKSAANLRGRGFDFAFAAAVFDGPTLEVEDLRRDYGERRWVAIGVADGICLTVVYTDRVIAKRSGAEAVRRIISARRSNRKERILYDKAVGQE